MLVYLMTRKNNLPAYKALPLTAVIMFCISLFVFDREMVVINATVLHGLLTAFTPISIIWGAILLFKTMEKTGGMDTVQKWLNSVSSNKVAQLMIVGWAFPFLIEGASGFGTPAALAAPVLVGLGFPAVRVAVMVLIMDTVPVSFGAVGTPTWFGFSGISLTADQLAEVGVKSAVIHGAAALVMPLIALSFVVPWKDIRANIGFIYLSILSTVIPYVMVAFYSYEFPSLVGGFIGLLLSVIFAKQAWGLECTGGTEESVTMPELLKAAFPLWGTLVILVITRVSQIGIKPLLVSTQEMFALNLGFSGNFSVSTGLVLSLENIFETGVTWGYKSLYVPALIPFGLVSLITFIVFRVRFECAKNVVMTSTRQMLHPAITLFGALVFVGLMMVGGETSAVSTIGDVLAALCGDTWQLFAAYLGAVGSFFSGSNTISNLTFGSIQDSIAVSSGLSRTTILALQSVGGAMGNMVCINAIVAVCSVLCLDRQEGYILKKTFWPMITYGVIAAVISYLI